MRILKMNLSKKTFSYSRNLFLEKHKTDDAIFDVPCKILSRGNYSAIKQTRVIRSLSELNKNLLRHLSLENIDFEKNTLVLACAGRFSTGGYSLQLQSARLHEKTLHLHFVVLYRIRVIWLQWQLRIRMQLCKLEFLLILKLK